MFDDSAAFKTNSTFSNPRLSCIQYFQIFRQLDQKKIRSREHKSVPNRNGPHPEKNERGQALANGVADDSHSTQSPFLMRSLDKI